MSQLFGCEIRAYDGGDADALVDIWLAASRIGHPFFSDAELTTQSALVRDIYLPQAENWVACCDGRPAGFIGLLDHFIGGLFIDPAMQGRGIGRALVEHALRRKGELELDVYAANPMAPAFYARLGFRETSRRPNDDGGLPLEVIRMHRRRDV